MKERPELIRQLDGQTFRSCYYLKEELVRFLRDNQLPTSGGKLELTERTAAYLDGGEVLPASARRPAAPRVGQLSEDMPIEANFVCSEKHRAFFRERIGKSFSFNVAFQKWLKTNTGKTYGDAIEAYHRILAEKKQSKTTIDKQFEYNTYIRAFFEDNPGRSLTEAIACWNHKKRQQGHHRYERSDLAALEE